MKPLGTDRSASLERVTLTGWALAAALTLLAVIAYLLRYVLLPFALAGALAYIAEPAVTWLQSRLKIPRWAAALIVYVAYLGLAFGLVVLAKVALVPQIADLLEAAPRNLHRVLVTVFGGELLHALGRTISAKHISSDLNARADALLGSPATLIGFGRNGVEAVAGFFLTLAVLGYFLIDGTRLRRGALWLVPPRFRSPVATVAADVAPVIYGYVRGVIIVVAYAILVSWIVFRFVARVPDAAVLAAVVGLLEAVPFFGPIASIILIALVAAEQATPATLVALAAFVTGLRLSIDLVVGPLVLGKSVKLPPPMIIFAFLAGATLFGPVGVLLAIPTCAAARIILGDLYGDSPQTLRHPRRAKNRSG